MAYDARRALSCEDLRRRVWPKYLGMWRTFLRLCSVDPPAAKGQRSSRECPGAIPAHPSCAPKLFLVDWGLYTVPPMWRYEASKDPFVKVSRIFRRPVHVLLKLQL